VKLARFSPARGEAPRLGIVTGDEIVDLGAVPGVPADMCELLALGDEGLALVAAAERGAARSPLADVRLLAPIERPQKFFAVGLNYADHVAESGMETPEFPTVFTKMSSCVTGPFDAVERPKVSDSLDYEGELGVVIGRECRHVSREETAGVIAGYLICNDVSVRDWQLRTTQWVLGKSFDTHGPIGPYVTTADEVDAGSLDIRTWVNGELRQSSNTSNLIFDIAEQVAILSTVCTLLPGDIIATGTPGGVGQSMKPPRFLVPGDVVRVQIDGLGAIENQIVQEA
jgi:2-keto-4-pentenoate hydratase/2-oxohepta-3-ene-1,7-dioic acid hydratase in catechol pathway